MRSLAILAALISTAVMVPSSADAATVIKTLTLSGNLPSGGSAPSNPFVTFTLSFDNSASFKGTTNGVSLISTNMFAPVQIAYNAGSDFLTLVGGNGSAETNGCNQGNLSFCSFINNISSNSPTSNLLLYIGSGNKLQYATNLSVANVSSAVPEPATWTLMLLGFGMVGFAMRKRSSVRMTVSYA